MNDKLWYICMLLMSVFVLWEVSGQARNPLGFGFWITATVYFTWKLSEAFRPTCKEHLHDPQPDRL